MFGVKRNGITLVIKEFKDGCGGCHLPRTVPTSVNGELYTEVLYLR